MGYFIRNGLFIMLAFLAVSTHAQTILNNNLLRFGNGTENSVNGTGNVRQPFYYSTQFNSWRKLTFSNYALNQSFAFGGVGTNDWNLNGTLVSDPMLTNQVFDDSNFNYNSGTSGPGRGIIVSTGTVSVNGNIVQLQNTYTLGNSSFIAVNTKITNTGTQPVTNLRYWVGTQDDFVGGSDVPVKERGNLVDGVFQPIALATAQSQAIRIKTNQEGVLFFSTSERTKTIVNSCCSWSNVLNQNPATSATVTGNTDGSYGVYIRMNDLAPGQNDEFTWYYAAANLADLDGVVNEVAQAAGGLANVTCNSAIFEAESTVAGTGYLITVPGGSAVPTEAQIKAGVAYAGVSPIFASATAMSAGVEYEINITGLSPTTTYQAYFVREDGSAVFSAIIAKNMTTMDNPAIAFAKTDASCVASEDGQLVATATNGTAPFTYQWTGGPAADTYSNINPGSYSVLAVDANNCQASASHTVGIDDVIAPVAVARNMNVYLNASGQASITEDALDNGSTDNCAIGSKSISVSSFSCANLANVVNVSLTITDAAGNTNSAIGVVTVIDTIKPLLVVKPVVVQLNQSGMGVAATTDANNGSSDNCAIASMSLSKTLYTCADIGVSEAIFSASDASGNEQSMPVQVTVVDNIAPIVAVQNVVLELDENASAQLNPSSAVVSATDNCSLASQSLSKTSFNCNDLGDNTVTVTVTDNSGNETLSTFTVSVEDNIQPTAAPQNITLALGADGTRMLSAIEIAQLIGAASVDNCSIDAASHALSQASFDCSDLGVQTLMYSVADASANVAEASVQIEIVDEVAPVVFTNDLVLLLGNNGSAMLTAEMVDNGSTDNCGVVSRIVSKSLFNCADVGTQTVELSVMDASLNISIGMATITVLDEMAPSAQIAAGVSIYLNENGQATLDAEAVAINIFDNCGPVEVSLMQSAFDCNDEGAKGITLLVADAHGNVFQIDGNINVMDTIKPSFNIASIELVLDENNSAVLTQAMLLPHALDNCGIAEVAIQNTVFDCAALSGNATTEIVVFDLHGNVIQRTLQIIVKDMVNPQVQVSAIEIDLDANGEAILDLDMLDYQDMDNCGIASRELNKSIFTCADLGIAEAILTVTDLGGNTATATFAVTVKDQIAPVFDAPEVINICEGRYMRTMVPAYDNCNVSVKMIDGPQDGKFISTGQYMLLYEASDVNGNVSTIVVRLHVYPNPVVNLGENITVDAGSVLTLIAGFDESATYNWSTGQTSPSIEVVANDDMTISVEVTTAVGCTGIDEININTEQVLGVAEAGDENQFSIFPNPTAAALYIRFAGAQAQENIRVAVIDMNGREVLSKQFGTLVNQQVVELNTDALASGVYLVRLQTETLNLTHRMIKQ